MAAGAAGSGSKVRGRVRACAATSPALPFDTCWASSCVKCSISWSACALLRGIVGGKGRLTMCGASFGAWIPAAPGASP